MPGHRFDSVENAAGIEFSAMRERRKTHKVGRSMDHAKTPSRRALGLLAAGAYALLALRGDERAAGGRKRKKKKRCPTPNPCPERACCVCGPTSSTPGCRVAGPAGSLTLRAVCDAACGGEGTFAAGLTSSPGVSAACALNTSGVLQGCTAVRCPL